MRSIRPFVRNGFLEPTFEDMNKMFDKFFEAKTYSLSADKFKVDLQNNDKEYVIDADLPGIDKEDIKITLEDDHLTIGFEKKSESTEEDKEINYVHKERSYQSMQRRFYLPNSDAYQVTASMDKGVLNIKIPKKENNKRQIEIGIK